MTPAIPPVSFEITVFECSQFLGAFICGICHQWHNTELSRIQGSTLQGFCPIERTRIEFRVVKQVPLDETPAAIRATAIVGNA